jgi:hypothetical protein
VSSTSGGFLTLSITKNSAATDMTWSAESCDDLASWTSANVTVLTDTTGTFQARDNFAVGAGGKRFLRLRLSRQ